MKLKKTVFTFTVFLFSLFCLGNNIVFGLEESATIRGPSLLLKMNQEKNDVLETASSGVVRVISINEAGDFGLTGSGIIISPEGFIITNQHVVGDTKYALIILKNHRMVLGEVIKADPKRDFALVKVEAKYMDFYQKHFLQFGDSDKIKIGDWVATIGTPFSLEWTHNDGIVSAVKRDSQKLGVQLLVTFVQTNADINPGNSGGALINSLGEVIGITSIIIPGSSGGSIGLGFAISSNDAQKFVDETFSNPSPKIIPEKSSGEKKPIPWIGIEFRGLKIKEYLKIVEAREQKPGNVELGKISLNSFLMEDVSIKGPAEKAGLKKDDIIYLVDGREFLDSLDFPQYVVSRPIGDEFILSVLRGYSDFLEIKLMSEEKQVEPRIIVESEAQPAAWLGITFDIVRDFPEELEKELKLDSGVQAYHFFIKEIAPMSPAEKAGLKVKDVIIFYDKNEAKGTEKFIKHLAGKNPGDILSLIIIRDGRTMTLEVVLEASPSEK